MFSVNNSIFLWLFAKLKYFAYFNRNMPETKRLSRLIEERNVLIIDVSCFPVFSFPLSTFHAVIITLRPFRCVLFFSLLFPILHTPCARLRNSSHFIAFTRWMMVSQFSHHSIDDWAKEHEKHIKIPAFVTKYIMRS